MFVNYVDVQVINYNGKLETDLYIKLTDKHQYMHLNIKMQRGDIRELKNHDEIHDDDVY